MKQFILTFMAAVMVATSSFAMSPALDEDGFRDYATVETPIITDDTIIIEGDTVSDWDYFWGTTLNPVNTGWNDFWFQCQDETKSTGDCVGTVFAGVGIGVAAAVAVVGVGIVAATVGTTTVGTAISVRPKCNGDNSTSRWVDETHNIRSSHGSHRR